jgi:hypothetical protein
MSFQERVISEKEALEVKLNDLSKFLTDLEQGAIDVAISQEHVALLNTQLLHMTGYLVALEKRIALFALTDDSVIDVELPVAPVEEIQNDG